MKYFINVQGGTGLNFGLASFLVAAKAEHPDDEYFVSSPYYDIFESCPAVSGVYKPQEMRDFIFDAKAQNGTIINHRLYDISDFIFKKMNYSQAWAKLLGYDWEDTPNGTKVTSVLNPLKPYPFLQNQVDQMKKAIADKGFKNYILVQFQGGQSPLVQVPDNDWSKVPYDYINEPLKRHYPIDMAQKFCELYHEKHPETAIINYCLPNEPQVVGDYIFTAVMPYLAYYLLAKDAVKAVTIDSSLQHLIAGVTPTTVIWGHSLPENFGYSYNNNIVQNCRRDDILYFTALGASGARVDYIKPEDLLEAADK